MKIKFWEEKLPKFCYVHGCELIMKEVKWRNPRFDKNTGQGYEERANVLYCPILKKHNEYYDEDILVGKPWKVPVKANCE